ncbi:hypothetical protein ROZALSC1DRAFT_28943 [Rozella allomycis CSF55]|uniref:Uncharacterized protein n=1 Tax=Rozella allomycis (strain CSF55) TaxID=988480 RepID=A0A4P9YKR7_ROZAC|nr:hypothetical protein ROZALSC1DRAFT_28943 [Rozella allomycis CSF55]
MTKPLYTLEYLLSLRDSPLVSNPKELQSFKQEYNTLKKERLRNCRPSSSLSQSSAKQKINLNTSSKTPEPAWLDSLHVETEDSLDSFNSIKMEMFLKNMREKNKNELVNESQHENEFEFEMGEYQNSEFVNNDFNGVLLEDYSSNDKSPNEINETTEAFFASNEINEATEAFFTPNEINETTEAFFSLNLNTTVENPISIPEKKESRFSRFFKNEEETEKPVEISNSLQSFSSDVPTSVILKMNGIKPTNLNRRPSTVSIPDDHISKFAFGMENKRERKASVGSGVIERRSSISNHQDSINNHQDSLNESFSLDFNLEKKNDAVNPQFHSAGIPDFNKFNNFPLNEKTATINHAGIPVTPGNESAMNTPVKTGNQMPWNLNPAAQMPTQGNFYPMPPHFHPMYAGQFYNSPPYPPQVNNGAGLLQTLLSSPNSTNNLHTNRNNPKSTKKAIYVSDLEKQLA